uniref:Uncharacterized protein n=1 Tax=Ixodes ricinus TaxID=34613 RepID=A0A0K8R775_IXORI
MARGVRAILASRVLYFCVSLNRLNHTRTRPITTPHRPPDREQRPRQSFARSPRRSPDWRTRAVACP